MTYVAYGFCGSLEKFNSILRQINFGERDVLYVLGDLADGEGAMELICDMSMRLNVYPVFGKKDFLALKLLSGFDKMLREGTAPDASYIEQMKFWVANGGQVILDGFRELDEDMREGVLDYLGDLMLYDETTVRGKTYFMLNGGIAGFDPDADPDEYEPVDVSYFFGPGADSVCVNPVMYPDWKVMARCGMMHDSGTEDLLKMWSRVKGDSASVWTYTLICIVFLGLIAAIIVKYAKKRYRRQRYAMKRRKRA